jgi:hypothetical protein
VHRPPLREKALLREKVRCSCHFCCTAADRDLFACHRCCRKVGCRSWTSMEPLRAAHCRATTEAPMNPCTSTRRCCTGGSRRLLQPLAAPAFFSFKTFFAFHSTACFGGYTIVMHRQIRNIPWVTYPPQEFINITNANQHSRHTVNQHLPCSLKHSIHCARASVCSL